MTLPTIPTDDCNDCTPAYLRRQLAAESPVTILFSSLPFALTFLFVSALVLQKLFPLLSSQVGSASDKAQNGRRSSLVALFQRRSTQETVVTTSTGRSDYDGLAATLAGAKGAHTAPNSTSAAPMMLATGAEERPTVRKISAVVFSVTIALSAVLAELLLCEISNSFDPAARGFALRVTVASLLSLLVIAIPLLELYSMISTAGWKFSGREKGRLRLAWVIEVLGFMVWIVGFWTIGTKLPVTHLRNLPGATQDGLIEGSLERIGIIGISLMASLSGFASVSALWQNFGVKHRPVQETDIARKQTGLESTQSMILAKQSRLRALNRKMSDNPSEGFLQKAMTSIRGNADMQERKTLEFEIQGLKTMELSLASGVSLLQSRRSAQLRARTPFGRVLVMFSYAFSIYCAYRIATTSISIFRRFTATYSSPLEIANTASSGSADPITQLLALLAKHYDPSLDRAAWSRQISFLLSGIILLASLSAVMQTFHFFARFTPSLIYTAQANLALLVSQVCGMYVISSALLMRGRMPKDVGSVISDALGTGVLEPAWVDRWFEGWFLGAVMLTAGGIWIGRKVGGQGGTGMGWAGEDEDEGWDGDVEMGKRS